MKIKLNRDLIKSLNSLIDYLLINLMLTFFRNYFYKKNSYISPSNKRKTYVFIYYFIKIISTRQRRRLEYSSFD